MLITIDVITIFPQLFENVTKYGVIKEGELKNISVVKVHNLRDFTKDKHGKVDDRPYGGGPGMVLCAQPVVDAVNYVKKINKPVYKDLQKVILLTPRGEKLNQRILKNLSIMKNLILICGRYEGVDERIRELVVDMEISIGDYVLTGGEIPAMIIIDGVTRLLEGIVGKEESLKEESFENNLLDFPQYTRPEEYRGLRVPDVLRAGDHGEIKKWRLERSIELTKKNRPDLFDKKI